METFVVLVLLSSALALCGADAAPDALCSVDNHDAAARLAVQAIHDNHDHGYKFKFHKVLRGSTEQVQDGCKIDLHLQLNETSCTVTNPKHVDECDVREDYQRPVLANCSVMLDVTNNVGKVTRYECETRQKFTNIEMMHLCPDCPTLIPLNNPDGLKAIVDAVKQFNQNTSNSNMFVLHEVGRVTSYYMMMAGMVYNPHFTLVETRCPRVSRILPEACVPLCPKRASHAYCKARHFTAKGLQSVDCEFYPPEDNHNLAPGEVEPVCENPHTGPPPPNGPPGPPGSVPPFSAPPRPRFQGHVGCHDAKPGDKDKLHPICSWPVVQMLHPRQDSGQVESQSKIKIK